MPLLLKLFMNTLVFVVFILGVGLYSSETIGKTAGYINSVYDGPLQSINYARTTENNFLQLNFLLYKQVQEKKLNADSLADINSSLEVFTDNLKIAAERAKNEKSQKAVTDIGAAVEQWKLTKDKLFHAGATYDEINPIAEKIQSRLADLSEFEATAGYDYVIATEKAVDDIKKRNTVITILAVFVGVVISLLVSLNIIRPVKKCVRIAESISEGNLDNSIDSGRRDELGKLLRAFAKMQTGLVQYIENKQKKVHEAQQAEEMARKQDMLAAISDDLRQSMQNIFNVIAQAVSGLNVISEELSFVAQQSLTQSGSSSDQINQVSLSISSVASAAEELSASIAAITDQTARSSSTAEQASQNAKNANEAVVRLAETSNQVGAVLSLISNIASQINLLALNATIEAARAGEAGKGFTVVASEVKNLAIQTEQATDQVRMLIGNVQSVSQEVVDAIQGISTSIVEVQNISTIIAHTMTEQSNATKEISTMVQTTSGRATDVVSIMQKVTESSQLTKDSSEKVMGAAKMLGSEMEKLESSVMLIANKIKNA